jgi:hypothetical protein
MSKVIAFIAFSAAVMLAGCTSTSNSYSDDELRAAARLYACPGTRCGRS